MKKSIILKILPIFLIFITLLPFLPIVLGKVVETEIVRMHIQAEGMDLWDPTYHAFIKVKYGYDPTLVQSEPPIPQPVVGLVENAMFKKYTIDPVTGEETVLFLGILHKGYVVYLGDVWQNPDTMITHQDVWYVIGEGKVKNSTGPYRNATIDFLFFGYMQTNIKLLFARFDDGDIQGPFPNSEGRPGMITYVTKF